MFIYGFYLAVVLVIAIPLVLLGRYLPLWIQAYTSRTKIRFHHILLMSLRGVNPRRVVESQVKVVYANLAGIATAKMESHILAGGNLEQVILALIISDRAGISLDWESASSIDLAGRDILETVRASVKPRVIQCPQLSNDAPHLLIAVAKDGISLKISVRITVKAEISKLIGGATEPTIIARIGQAIVSSIGACATYQEALSNPSLITKGILAGPLDSNTSFSIISIDIAVIDVGDNIGAALRLQQADADVRVAKAAAESRRAMALAAIQEMVALGTEMRSRVVRAEASLPRTIAQSIRLNALSSKRLDLASWLNPKIQLRGKLRRSDDLTMFADTEQILRRETWEEEGGYCLEN